MAAQQRRPQRQAEEQRAQALHFADDLFIFIAVDNVQRLNRHILVALLGQLLQRLQRRINLDTVALLELADNHPGGEGAKGVAVRAAGRQLALAGDDILFTGVGIAGAKTDHQKRFFHFGLLKQRPASALSAGQRQPDFPVILHRSPAVPGA